MLVIVAFGLFVSGVTIWPWDIELSFAISALQAIAGPEPLIQLLQDIQQDMRLLEQSNSFVLYVADWLAFAHLVLAVLFLMALKNPIRNVLVVRFGILCSLSVPVLAITCIPMRGIPLFWVLIDSSFALCAIPLWIALKDIRKLEQETASGAV